MKALLFILMVALGLFALASRKHLNQELDPDDEDPRVEETIKNSQTASQHLNDAFNQMAQPQNQGTYRAPPPALQKSSIARTAADPSASASSLTAEINQYIKQMGESPENAASILEKGLAATTGPDSIKLRLSLLQAAQSVQGSEDLKNVALHELTSSVVEPQTDAPTDPTENSALETKRMIVSTAYKLFLNTTKDAESTYSETIRVLNYQRDQSTKELIIYDCLTRYPELRIRMLPNPQ